MASFDIVAAVNQRKTCAHTYIDTQDEEEAMLEVAGHGSLKTLATGVFLNIGLNLFSNGTCVFLKGF